MTHSELPPAPAQPRDAWLAALKSLVLPGLGQWHNGEFNKAAWWLLGFALLGIAGVPLVGLAVPAAWMLPALVSGLLLTLAVWLGGVVDAWRVARRAMPSEEPLPAGPEPALRPFWRQAGITVLLLVLLDVLALPLLTQAVRTHLVASFRIPSASMAPTLWPGDIVFADRRYACIGCAQAVRRGDVAIFAYPNDRTQYYVKRVVALPGDRVELAGSELRVNGNAVEVPAAPSPPAVAVQQAVTAPVAPAPAERLELTVPPGQVFVVGDARSASTDSRQFGGVPLADVVGRVRQVWWSSGADGVRWDRLGRVIQ